MPHDLPVAGRELEGIYFAKDYLESVTKSLLNSNLEDGLAIDAKDKDVVIIGGGDTGNDCMATVIRQGCRSVRQLEINPCLPHSRTADNPWPQFPRIFKRITVRRRLSINLSRSRVNSVLQLKNSWVRMAR